MEKRKFEFDVAVIGGGPAGMMAALRAARGGARVVIVEKKEKFGTKLLMTGGGRCNISQLQPDVKKLAEKYKNGKFLLPSFRLFGSEEFFRYFENLGVGLKIEKNGRVFPKSDKASDIVGTLRKKMLENGVNFFMESEVENFQAGDGNIEKLILKDGREVVAKNYVVAVGGQSYPQSGSSGQGYVWAQELGHTVVEPRPSLVPAKISSRVIPAFEPESISGVLDSRFRGNDKKESGNDEKRIIYGKLFLEDIKDIQGISLSDVKIGVFADGKKSFEQRGEILFTHFGLSGPAILNISAKANDLLKEGEVVFKIDLKPHLNEEKLDEILIRDFERNAGKNLSNCLGNLFSERVRACVLKLALVDPQKHAAKVSKKERRKIVSTIKGMEVPVDAFFGFERAMVTNGGVSTREIDSKTMRSKIMHNLFFAGEILDVDGPTGGYNLQMCWSTGYVAGENAARQ